MKYILSVSALMLLIPLILFSGQVVSALPVTLDRVSRVVLCVIFPSNVLLRLICFSPLGERAGYFFSKTRLWEKTGLSPSYVPAVISGMLSGIPAGASILGEIKGENRAKSLALASVISPAFLCAVTNSPLEGILLFFNMITVLFCTSFYIPCAQESSLKIKLPKTSFPAALKQGIETALTVAGSMIFFSSLLAILPDKAPGVIREALTSFFEVGTAAIECTHPFFRAVAFSFGGLAALSQISFFLDGVSLKYYLLSRISLFFAVFFFFSFPSARIFQSLFITFFLLWQISRKKT